MPISWTVTSLWFTAALQIENEGIPKALNKLVVHKWVCQPEATTVVSTKAESEHEKQKRIAETLHNTDLECVSDRSTHAVLVGANGKRNRSSTAVHAYEVFKLRKEWNKKAAEMLPIEVLTGDHGQQLDGVRANALQKLLFLLQYYQVPYNTELVIKLSGDGRRASAQINSIALTMQPLFDTLVHSSKTVHAIAIIRGKEDFSTLQQIAAGVSHQLVLARKYAMEKFGISIRYCFAADLKFMMLWLGMNASNADYFCPWCLCCKSDRALICKKHQLRLKLDKLADGTCSMTHQIHNNKVHNCSRSKHGAVRKPLFDGDLIEMTDCIWDFLHGKMAIIDRKLVDRYFSL